LSVKCEQTYIHTHTLTDGSERTTPVGMFVSICQSDILWLGEPLPSESGSLWAPRQRPPDWRCWRSTARRYHTVCQWVLPPVYTNNDNVITYNTIFSLQSVPGDMRDGRWYDNSNPA